MTKPAAEGPWSNSIPGTMKWYGWGAQDEHFSPLDRPYLWPYAQRHLGISLEQTIRPPVPLEAIKLRPPRLNSAFQKRIASAIPADRRSTHDLDRLLHAYGKSTRDLWRLRAGIVDFAPDCVVFPTSEAEVMSVLQAATLEDVVIIPFGGGSNVAGCVELLRPDTRMVVALDLRLMSRVIRIDDVSQTATVQPGLLGPALEDSLNQAGFTLGHFPDSFLYSTVGGWAASRSSGMMSDRYGNIEDMVISLRMATPTGIVRTTASPRASNGPDTMQLCIGSEGTLGVITELTLRVRRVPQRRVFLGYLFPDWQRGVAAVRECQQSQCAPDLSRLNDPNKTALNSAFRRKSGSIQTAFGTLVKFYLARARHFDFDQTSLLIVAFDGTPSDIHRRKSTVEKIYQRHGAAALGHGPGQAFADAKFDFPHVRDFLFDYDVICDVAETSTTWAEINKLYENTFRALQRALVENDHRYWLGCHLSHSYHVGAALYFTFAFRCNSGPEGQIDRVAEFQHYLNVKKTLLESFQAHGATLSHHHAVGYEHLPWLSREAALTTQTIVDAAKPALDPRDIMNPGKLRPGYTLGEWEARTMLSTRTSNT